MKEPYKTVIEKLVEAMKRKHGDRFISLVIFGSVARGEMRKDSDIDLLLIIDSISKRRLERQKEFIEVEKEIEGYLNKLFDEGYFIDFSPIIKTPEEAMRISPLYLDMVEDAIITYDKDDFFKDILENVRNRLKELGSKRISMGKRWYWILKPDYRFGEVIRIG
ncbi:MAG TPA: nucleotidyltransferase domain-containing protein [Desulfobacteraceae bacterium]|nr:MAG: nucleotidyltransferase domain-containing protein [Methanosarcinales archaeon]HDH87617.1 nucleotidyltransferase domain-containing protein [Desulfobacteraceae bacterium]